MKPKKTFDYMLITNKKAILITVFVVLLHCMFGIGNSAHAYFFQEIVPTNTLGKELWVAGHEGGNQNEWVLNGGGGEFNGGTGNSTVVTDVARTGKHSLKMSINTTTGNSHGTRNFRWSEIRSHNDLIFTQYVYFPNRIDLDRNNDWFNLIQTKGVKFAPGGAGTGPDQINLPHFVLGLKVRGGPGSGGANFLELSDLQKFWGSQPDAFWEAPAGIDIPVKKWVKIQMRIIQDRGSKGRILVWQDDVLIIDTKLRNTLRPEVDTNMYSINAYADKTYPNTTNIYIDDLSINLPGTQEQPIPNIPPTVDIVSPVNNSTIIGSGEIEIQAQVKSAINVKIAEVDFYNGNTVIGTSTQAPYSMKWANPGPGTYKFKVVARDANNMVVESKEVTLNIKAEDLKGPVPEELGETDPAPSPSDTNFMVNLNLGSNVSVTYNSILFESEPRTSVFPYFTYTYSESNASRELLFQTERNSPELRIEIPVENGLYKVITYHNELFFGINGPSARVGRRVFDIEIEGKLVKEKLDLFSESGNKPLQLVFENIEIKDGKINIGMIASANRATISGLTIISQGKSTARNFEPFEQFINAGSSKEVTYLHNKYKVDNSFSRSSTYKNINASEHELFQTERHSPNLKYAIPVANGTYTVKTYHNELWFGYSGRSFTKGRRVFDILLEGVVVKSKFDLFVESGNKPAELVFQNIIVKDGVLNLDLVAFANNASISGIAVIRTSDSSDENLRVHFDEDLSNKNSEEWVKKSLEAVVYPRIYPNPATENIFVDLGPNADNYRYFLIHDMQGRLVNHYLPLYLSRDNGKFIIPIAGLNQGVYLVSLVDKDNRSDKFRLMVNP